MTDLDSVAAAVGIQEKSPALVLIVIRDNGEPSLNILVKKDASRAHIAALCSLLTDTAKSLQDYATR